MSSVDKYGNNIKYQNILIVSSILILIISTALVNFTERWSLETSILLTIYNWPSWLQPILLVVSYLGSVLAAAILGVYLILRRKKFVFLFLASGALTYFVVEALKVAVSRPRPFETLNQDIVARDLSAHGFGFPSGHVAIAVVIAFTLKKVFPKVSLGWWISFVGIIAISRLYLGVHDFLDVIAGAAVAILVCFAIEILDKRTKNINK